MIRTSLGIVALVWGANLLVRGGGSIALKLGISPLVVGILVLAFGTSLPEIATSLIASFHGKEEFAVGNAIGSNIFNILAVLGVTALLVPIPVPQSAISFDMPVLLAVGMFAYYDIKNKRSANEG